MSQRDANLLWLKDLLRHLDGCQRQLEWAEEPEAVHLVTENMLRDLDSCRRICESLRRRLEPALGEAVGSRFNARSSAGWATGLAVSSARCA